MLRVEELLALYTFFSYFILIVVLFLIITGSWPSPDVPEWRQFVFLALAMMSLGHTWYYMFKYLSWSFADFHSNAGSSESLLTRLTSWLVGTKLFEQAWAAVSFGQMNWWWSEQLCLFTVGAWTTLLATEGPAHDIKYLWAYMLLGQLVAISVASNLFYLALTLSPRRSNSKKSTFSFAAPTLWLSVLLSLITVALTPYTSHQTFLPNLLAMHILILIPLYSSQPTSEHPGRFSLNVKTVYTMVAVVSAVLRLRTTAFAILSLPPHSRSVMGFFNSAVDTLYSHPAQSSIGWDVIWTSISFVVWVCVRPSPETQGSKLAINAPFALAATSLASIGVATPWVLRRLNEQKGNSKSQ